MQSLATKVLIVFVRLDITRVSTRHIPTALTLMARQRLSMRNLPGLTFYKLMGTGSGKTFTIRDADLHHWCVLSVWETYEDCSAFLSTKPAKQWQKLAMSQANIELEPLSAKGTWAKKLRLEIQFPKNGMALLLHLRALQLSLAGGANFGAVCLRFRRI